MHITQKDGPAVAEKGRVAIKRPNPVHLQKMEEPFTVETVDGTLSGEVGGYLAYDPISGHVWPVKASYVEQHYDFRD